MEAKLSRNNRKNNVTILQEMKIEFMPDTVIDKVKIFVMKTWIQVILPVSIVDIQAWKLNDLELFCKEE